jgi:hypothetical protein
LTSVTAPGTTAGMVMKLSFSVPIWGSGFARAVRLVLRGR